MVADLEERGTLSCLELSDDGREISSAPDLLVNQDRLFPCGNQSITHAAIIESGTDPSSVARFQVTESV
jgi:hypothetical protein